ncbi:MAG: hypothetical protein ABJ360_22360 [Roseobacter sp.]
MRKPRIQTQLQKATTAIRHFEDAGRDVVGVAILKDGIKIEFSQPDKLATAADLINMGEK